MWVSTTKWRLRHVGDEHKSSLGANRSHGCTCGEDLPRRHGREDALSCFDTSGFADWWPSHDAVSTAVCEQRVGKSKLNLCRPSPERLKPNAADRSAKVDGSRARWRYLNNTCGTIDNKRCARVSAGESRRDCARIPFANHIGNAEGNVLFFHF